MLISQEPHISSARPFVGPFLFSFPDLLITLQPDTKPHGSTNDSEALFISYNTRYSCVLIPETSLPLSIISFAFIFLAAVKPAAAINHRVFVFHTACSLLWPPLPRRPLAHSLLLCQLADHPRLCLCMHPPRRLRLMGNLSPAVCVQAEES